VNGLAIGLGLLTASVVTIIVTWPWWEQRLSFRLRFEPVARPSRDPKDDALSKRYNAVLTAMRDLDFDHAVGKLIGEDYMSLRQALLAEAADIVAHFDEPSVAEAEIDEPYKVEFLVIGQPSGAADELEFTGSSDSVRACTSCGRIPRPGSLFCTTCGRKLDPVCDTCGGIVDASDRFCAGCGRKLALAFS
jgi:hypothetical protein